MNCEDLEQYLPDYFAEESDENTLREIKEHLRTCGDCRREAESLADIWRDVARMPDQPHGENMHARFFAMLEAYKISLSEKSVLFKFNRKKIQLFMRRLSTHPLVKAAAVLLLFSFGLSAGYLLKGSTWDAGMVENEKLRIQVRELNQMVTLSLLDQSSPSSRLKGITMSYQINDPDENVLQALLATLENDPNLNVRLASVDALLRFANHEEVRMSLVNTMENESSPNVQVAIIEVITMIGEKRALPAFRRLLMDENLNSTVREKLETGLVALRDFS